jgi:PLP dependent protein
LHNGQVRTRPRRDAGDPCGCRARRRTPALRLIMGHYEKPWQAVRERIDAAARAAGREPATIQLVVVSKTFPPEAVRAVYRLGQRAFGENYVQEALAKMDALGDLGDLEWHLIGPLQSNKARLAARHFAWVHTVDRLAIAERLAAVRAPELPPLNVCVQVNISGEATKSGVDPAEVVALATAVAALPRLNLRGLMGIAAPTADSAQQRAQMHRLGEGLQACRGNGLTMDTLSMGMSGDLEAAIKEGATLVRVGSAIFGERNYQ